MLKESETDKTKCRSIQDVYDVIERWLFIQDTKRIDAILATAISNQKPGTPIWMFFIGNSGDTKSELINSLTVIPNTMRIDQITPNTLVSGKKNVDDLGSELENKSTILLFPDLAALSSLNKDAKKEIWSQWRNLYDGFVMKRTGNNVNKAYENIHVTVIAGATPSLRDEYHIHQQLGTRELLYDTEAEPRYNKNKMRKAWENETYEAEMRKDIQDVIYGFWANHKFKEITIPDEIKDFIFKEAERLSILRATAMTDWKYGELTNFIHPEVPTRLVKQLKRLYQALKSLDNEYSDERAKSIISHVVDSSGNKIRQAILDTFNKNPENEYTIPNLHSILKIGRTALKTELEILWNLGIISKDVRNENVGGYVYKDDYYQEQIRGGKWQDVAYYKLIKKEEQTISGGLDEWI